jgi:hypothetical protein
MDQVAGFTLKCEESTTETSCMLNIPQIMDDVQHNTGIMNEPLPNTFTELSSKDSI